MNTQDNFNNNRSNDIDPTETQEWLEAFQQVIAHDGIGRAKYLLAKLLNKVDSSPAYVQGTIQTAYVNTIPTEQEPDYPGDLQLERKITNINRWNALVMVLQANKKSPGIGGHISSYASSATLYDVAYNHIFQGADLKRGFLGDVVFFSGTYHSWYLCQSFFRGFVETRTN